MRSRAAERPDELRLFCSGIGYMVAVCTAEAQVRIFDTDQQVLAKKSLVACALKSLGFLGPRASLVFGSF